jgi:prepilin-type N-terminal cleavage/methylation domain-containing protein
LLARSRVRRGFTLIEMMTAVAIVAILASLAVTYMMYGMGKARMNNAVFDATALISGAQLRAMSHGTDHFVFISQSASNRTRIQVLEMRDPPPLTPANWNTLDLSAGPEAALTFTRTLPDGTLQTVKPSTRDELVLGVHDADGLSSGGLAFLDLDSTRIRKPLPAPFSAIAITTPSVTPSNVNQPTQNLMAGCNFCVNSSGFAYGVLHFNADGTMDVVTGNAESGAVIAFAPDTEDEKGFSPKLLTISHPAGAAVVF